MNNLTAEMFGGYARTEGAELAYVVKGNGAPVLMIPGGVFADTFYPLLKVDAFTANHRLISYHRRGYGNSSHSDSSSVRQEVADALAVMQQLDLKRVHIVGHSYGGVIALQLTLDAPQKVQTLTMMEPPLVNLIPQDPDFATSITRLVELYQTGNKAEAVDSFLRFAAGAGEEYRAIIDAALPKGAWDLAVKDADILFKGDFPGVMTFRFTEEDAKRVKQPVLLIRGTSSGPANLEMQKVIQSWILQAESSELPGVTHLLQMQDPKGVAKALAAFIAKHSIG
jgi:3-oxoadipate enol-lactonase